MSEIILVSEWKLPLIVTPCCGKKFLAMAYIGKPPASALEPCENYCEHLCWYYQPEAMCEPCKVADRLGVRGRFSDEPQSPDEPPQTLPLCKFWFCPYCGKEWPK